MVSVRPLLPAVRRSPEATSDWIFGSKRAVSPITRRRTPLRCSLRTSLVSAARNSCISSATSSAGRRQFSELNANSVRKPTPRSVQARTMPRTASTPRWCPAKRGSPRCRAQRPLPSMMIATCCGTSPLAGIACVELACVMARASYRHQLRFLLLQQLVDAGDVLVGELLDLVLGPALVVLGDLFLFQRLLEVVVGVAPQVAYRDARGLGFVAHHLDQLLAALFRERRQRHADPVSPPPP